ncbi:MAG: hypothetical protein Tsb0010_08400 [Parvularculaceae bacterium]
MSAIRAAIAFVRFTVAPTFFALAIMNFSTAQSAGHGAHAAGSAVGGATETWLSSMWLMYALMGVAHITPWLGLIANRRPAADY